MRPPLAARSGTFVSRSSTRRERRIRPRRLALAALFLVACGYFAFGVSESWSDSPTFDEPTYVAAGLAAILHHDVAINDEHPVLPKVLAALPVLFVHPVIPSNDEPTENNEYQYVPRFTAAQVAAGTLRRTFFVARLVPLLESTGVAFALFALGCELFGVGAGLVAGLAWLGTPFVLGIGHLDGTDVPFALTVVLASWALARWLRVRSRRALVALGIALAAALMSEATGVLVLAGALAVVAMCASSSGLRRAMAETGLVVLVAWLGVWAVYGALDPSLLAHPWSILPHPYVDGVTHLARHDTSAGSGYLLGTSFKGGVWWYWPVSLVVKLPATLLVVLTVATVSWVWLAPELRRRALLALGPSAFVLGGFTVVSTTHDIGLRYLLPVIALWMAGAGALVPVVLASRRRARYVGGICLSGLLLVGVVTTGLSFPDSLSWTAPPFHPAYTATTDSDVDWGQGLYQLQTWAHGRRILVAYFGPRGLKVAAVVPTARALTGVPVSQVRGWVAVSATDLTSAVALTGGVNRATIGWLRNYCPVTVLGGSILVYHFVEAPIKARAPARPALPCSGPNSTRRVRRTAARQA